MTARRNGGERGCLGHDLREIRSRGRVSGRRGPEIFSLQGETAANEAGSERDLREIPFDLSEITADLRDCALDIPEIPRVGAIRGAK